MDYNNQANNIHQCKAILIHCIDFRLINKTREWMQNEGLMADCDVVSLAGASKELVDGNENIRELILKQISISKNLHHASRVILLHHSDCGAYKSSYKFSTPKEEKQKQLDDMEKAKKIILEKFPEIEVIKIWLQMKDDRGSDVEFIII